MMTSLPIDATTVPSLTLVMDRALADILSQLQELRFHADSESTGDVCASEYAFDTGVRVLRDAAAACARAGRSIPRGRASTDDEGGIQVQWIRTSAGVNFVVPGVDSRPGYIYHEVGDTYGTCPPTADNLSRWLSEID